MAVFPEVRLRRLRRNAPLRAMFCETRLAMSDLVYPMFVIPGRRQLQEIPSMPGIYRLSADQAAKEA
jgi:porphobilinogen synthase